MSPKVSIIIPIYNAEVFLDNTIKSALNQSYKNLEIILVNDCSTDKSKEICLKYSLKDKRIVFIDKSINEGVDYARFTGIEAASGDYLTFIDADDWFNKNSIQVLVDSIVKFDADILFANNIRCYSQRFNIKKQINFNPSLIDRSIVLEEKDNLFVSFFGKNILPVTIWGHLYKSSLFKNDIKKSGLKFGEDLLLNMQLYYHANSIAVIDYPTVNYRWGGVTCRYQPSFLAASKELYIHKLQYIREKGFDKFERYTVIEMINCLSSEVSQLATYFPKAPIENIRKIKEEMGNPLFNDFAKYQKDPYFKSGNINTETAHLRAEEAYYAACRMRDLPRSKMRRFMKRTALFFLKFIKL